MPLPTTYGNLEDKPLLQEGEIWFTFAETVILSGYNADTVKIEAGQGVIFGSASGMGEKNPLLLPVDANSVIRGCAVNNKTVAKDSTGVIAYPPKPANADNLVPLMPYLTKGIIGVRLFGSVTKGQAAFCQHTAASGNKARWGASANSGAAVAVADTEFLWSGSAGQIVPLWFK